jgi:hypothetical protein
MSTDDFFDNAFDPEGRSGVRRDQYGRSLLVPAGQPKTARQPYTSMSTLAGMLSDASGLHTWEKRLLARGLGGRPDLVALAAALSPLTGDSQFDRISNADADSIIERALDFAGRDVKADWGTAVHAFTEPDADRSRIPTRQMANDVEAYDYAMAGSRQILSEVFVANDDLTAAGSFDGTYSFMGWEHVIGDKKTGKYKPLACAIQLAGYRGGDIYDVHTDGREAWPDDVSNDIGIVIHVPYGEARATIYGIDLGLGRELASLAAEVRDKRRWENKGSEVNLHWLENPRDRAYQHLAKMVDQVTTPAEANALYRKYPLLWDDAMTERGRTALARRTP